MIFLANFDEGDNTAMNQHALISILFKSDFGAIAHVRCRRRSIATRPAL